MLGLSWIHSLMLSKLMMFFGIFDVVDELYRNMDVLGLTMRLFFFRGRVLAVFLVNRLLSRLVSICICLNFTNFLSSLLPSYI